MTSGMLRGICQYGAAVVFFCSIAGSSVAECRGPRAAVPANERGSVWIAALDAFAAEQPALSEAQARWVDRARGVGIDLSSPNEVKQGTAVRIARDLVANAAEVFSEHQIGALFSAMGSLQRWLADVAVIAHPYCNCVRGQSCSPLPGTCTSGCLTWDGSNADGICSSAN